MVLELIFIHRRKILKLRKHAILQEGKFGHFPVFKTVRKTSAFSAILV